MLERLIKEIDREYAGYKKNARKFIRDGHDYDKNAGLRHYITPGKWDKYQTGKITRTEAVKIAHDRMEKQYQKDIDKEVEKVVTAASKQPPKFISIRVEWKRSTVWGRNPVAEVIADDYTTGRASGCGYDKESAAVAKALRGQAGIMGIMYRMKDKHPKTNNHKLFGYGSGYGVLPDFEGGVGMNSICSVIESLGYKKTSEHHGKMCDFYDFELIKARGVVQC